MFARLRLRPLASRLELRFGRTLTPILQTEAGECGLACLAMISTWHRRSIGLRALREEFGAGLRGLTVRNLLEIARHQKMSGRAVSLELDELHALKCPCILHWDMNHYVVLKSVSRKHVRLIDPAKGELRLARQELESHFTGVAIELSPTLAFERRAAVNPINLRKIFDNIAGVRGVLLKLLALGLALECVAICMPLLTQWAFDGAIVGSDESLLSVIALSIATLTVLQVGISFGRSWLVLYMTTHLNVQWLSNAFGHLLRLPLVWFERRHLGDISSRFGSISFIQQTLTTGFVEATIDGVMAVSTLVVMILYSATLAIIPVAALAVYGLLRWALFGAYRRAAADSLALQAKQQTIFLESMRVIQTIKLFGSEEGSRGRWEEAMVDSTNRGLVTQKLTMLSNMAYAMLFGAEGILLIWFGARSVIHGLFSVGMLIAFLSFKDSFSGRVSSLMDKAIQLILLKVQAERVADIVLTAPEQQRVAVDDVFQFRSIELRNVYFRYSDAEPWILENLNLTICAGDSILLADRSGSGKTTLLKLLLGLMPPTKGELLINESPIGEIGLATWRKHIGAVMQDDQLLRGTIADNVTFFAENVDIDRVERCCREASVHDEISRMPMRYRTLVSEMGASLSGGQRQRIMLARALYRSPQILVLDEATSHLDPTNENYVLASLTKLKITRVQVSHGMEATTLASRVVQMDAIQGGPIRVLQRNGDHRSAMPAGA